MSTLSICLVSAFVLLPALQVAAYTLVLGYIDPCLLWHVAHPAFRILPEAAINLAHGVAYLCQCKKDRSAYEAYFTALDDVKKYGNLPIPMNVRNAPTKLMKDLGYGEGYEKYSKESFLPDELKEKKYLRK